jgi:hypothetical protein
MVVFAVTTTFRPRDPRRTARGAWVSVDIDAADLSFD